MDYTRHMNWKNDIWNMDYIQQNLAQQNHYNQIEEVQKSVKALKDFLDSKDKIQPQYQQMARQAYCTVLAEYFGKNR